MKHIYIFFILLSLSSCFRIPQVIEEGKSITLTEYAKMPEVARECSGMILTENELLVHNDGGDKPNIYRLNKNGVDTIGRVTIDGAVNVDWEAMTMHEDELIIADFGNNSGNRKNMKLYHVDKETYELKKTIPFSYPDQVTFDDPKHNFDCEAIIVKDGKYLVFSKNRGNKNSNIYSAKLHSSELTFQDSIALEGMVTDAYYHEASDVILLLCYEWTFGVFKSSLALVKPMANGKFKTTNIFNLGPPEQFEAITHIEDNKFLIGSEAYLAAGRKLYTLTINGL